MAGSRVPNKLVDTTSRTGYTLTGAKPRDSHAKAAEYFNVCHCPSPNPACALFFSQFDWEYAQKPDQTSWIASSWVSSWYYLHDLMLILVKQGQQFHLRCRSWWIL